MNVLLRKNGKPRTRRIAGHTWNLFKGYVAEPVWGIVQNRIALVHPEKLCRDHPCPLHGHPSNHHMKDWPITIRLDKRALVERICGHGTGHPDPDSLAFLGRRGGLAQHGCCGCCVPPRKRAKMKMRVAR